MSLCGRHAERDLVDHPAGGDLLKDERELNRLRARRELADELQPPGRDLARRLRQLWLNHQDRAQVELLLPEVAERCREVASRVALAEALRSQIAENGV